MSYYDDIAPGYDDLHRKEQERKLQRVIKRLHEQDLPEGDILDVGCGTGFSLDLIASATGRRCVGIDPSQNMIDRYEGEQTILRGAAESLPYPDETFAAATSITAAHNFEDIEQGVEEMRRVTKDKGIVIITCLKKSKKLLHVTEAIASRFSVLGAEEEQHDLIFTCRKEALK